MAKVISQRSMENRQYVVRLLKQKQPGFSAALELAMNLVGRELRSQETRRQRFRGLVTSNVTSLRTAADVAQSIAGQLSFIPGLVPRGGPPGTLPGPPDTGLPTGFAVELAAGVHRSRDGRLMLGGSPPRLLRLNPAAARLLRPGCFAVTDHASAALARRLVDTGVAHPRPPACPVRDVTIVIPVRDRAAELGRLLARLRADPDSAELPVLVTDDGSADPAAVAAVAGAHGAVLLVHPDNRGPAAARNTGIRRARTAFVAFCDSDVLPGPGWLGPLLAQFADPAVALAAPRVLTGGGAPPWLDRYERVRSPLDMGDREAPIVPLSPLAYVPGAALVVRKAAIGGGFAPELRVAEDVDLCLRLHQSGWRLRYVPAAGVTHQPRSHLRSWLAQRASYGTGAADLALRHPGLVPPLYAAPWSVAACMLLLRGRPVPAALAAVLAARAATRLAGVMPDADTPVRAATLLTLAALRGTGEQLIRCAVRDYWPLAIVAAVLSRRARRAIIAGAVLDGILDHRRSGRPQSLLAHLLLRRLDDMAYGTGLWAGAIHSRSVAHLLPRFATRTARPSPPPRAESA
jgi:mycofactocin glycosyltransferase